MTCLLTLKTSIEMSNENLPKASARFRNSPRVARELHRRERETKSIKTPFARAFVASFVYAIRGVSRACRVVAPCRVVVKAYLRENSMPSKKKKYNARFPAVSEYTCAREQIE